MKNLGLFVLFAASFLHAQTTLEKCGAGSCYGYGAPTGAAANGYIYQDVSQTVPALYCAKNGAWVSCGGSGSAVPVAPQFRHFIQPNPGTVSAIGPSTTTTNAVDPIAQSQANSDLWINGGGNNGVANAVAAGWKDVLIPSDSTTTEDPRSITTGTFHSTDQRFAYHNEYFLNPDSAASGQAFGFPQQFLWNYQHAGPLQIISSFINDIYTMPGVNQSGSWNTHQGLFITSTATGRGIKQGIFTSHTCQSVGDCGGFYFKQQGNAGSQDASGEDMQMAAFDQTQTNYPQNGVVSTGSTGAMTVKVAFATNPQQAMDGATLLTTSDIEMSGNITGVTLNTFPIPNVYTTSDTHAVSAVKAFLTASCGTQATANAPISAVCAFTSSGGRGTLTAGVPTCVADSQQPETAQTTLVSGGNVTLLLRYNHPSGVPLYQGRPCGARVVMGFGYSNALVTNVFPTAYYVAGADTSTSFAGINAYKQNQNGQIKFNVPNWSTDNNIPTISMSIASASRSGTTVNLVLTGNTGSIFNGYTAPTGSSICISGVSDASFNTCGITGIVVTGGGFGLTYTQGSGSASGTGGTIMLATVANPTVNSMANYTAPCGAEVTALLNTTEGHAVGDGTMNLEANDCVNTVGATAIEPPFYNQHFFGVRETSAAFTAPVGNPNFMHQITLSGSAWSAGTVFGIATNDSASAMFAMGGTNRPRNLFNVSDYIAEYFNTTYPPLLGLNGNGVGCFACFGAFPANYPTSQYDIWRQTSNTGHQDTIGYDANNDSLTFGNIATLFLSSSGININSTSAGKLNLTGGSTQNGMTWDSVAGTHKYYAFTGVFQGSGWHIFDITSASRPFAVFDSGNVAVGTTSDLGQLFQVGANFSVSTAGAAVMAATSTVGGQLICVASGTNCPSGGGGGLSGQTAGYAVEAATATTATGPFPMDDSVTTANTITMHKPLAVTGAAGIRTNTASNTDVAGQLTLSSGSQTYTFTGTYTSAPICVATDTTTAAAVKASATTTVLTLTGTGTDVLNYVCIGRN